MLDDLIFSTSLSKWNQTDRDVTTYIFRSNLPKKRKKKRKIFQTLAPSHLTLGTSNGLAGACMGVVCRAAADYYGRPLPKTVASTAAAAAMIVKTHTYKN
jgi:hypothetical protein